MGFLKGLAVSLLSFLLFLSLSVFGLAFMLNSTILSPNFVTSELDRLDVSSLVEEIITEQSPDEEFSEELMTAMIDTVDKLEVPVKEQVNAAIHDTYDYLLGKSESPDLTVTLGNTFFNSDFVDSLMDELVLSSLAEEILTEQMGEEEFPEEFRTALVSTITELEPLIKQKVSAAADPIFDYLLEKTQSIDLAHMLRDTIFTSDFVASVLNKLDIATLAGDFLGEQLTEDIPEGMEYLAEYLDELLGDIVTEIEPTIKEELIAATDPVVDYLLGERQSLNVIVSLEPVMESLRDNLRRAFLQSPPSEFAGLPQAELGRQFDEVYQEYSEQIPSTFELDESLFGTEIPTQIAEGIAEAEEGLQQARQDIAEGIAEAEEGLEQVRPYVGYFQLGYKLLIVFMVLLVVGIVLINRNVKITTRSLGITSLIYGAIEYGGIFAANHFGGAQLAQFDLPPLLQEWLPQFAGNILSPLEMFSIGLMVAGVVLITVSFVYPRWRKPSV